MRNSIKTLVYMGAMHGFFTFYLPLQLASLDKPFADFGFFKYSAVPFWIIGAWVIIHCSVDIILRGGGTPAHLDPPRLLMLNGWYRHVRNPIYLGAVVVQIGHILWFGSRAAVMYLLLYIVAFHILIIFIEEPMLKNTFGAAYEDYCRKVPRWIPRLR